MEQTEVNLILGLATLVVPTIAFILRDWWRKRKGTVTYGDNLLEAMNKTTAALRDARGEIASMDDDMRLMDTKHETEIQDLIHKHKRERDALAERIRTLEKVLVRYDISFTLTTHPEVRVDNVRVQGREEVFDSQKLRAITKDQITDATRQKEITK